jgi:FkbM family methyltransferase
MDKEDLNIINYFKDKKNWRGINIDVSKFSIDLFNFLRPEDINVNVAISNKNSKIKVYYQKELSQLTTTVKDHADKFFQGNIKEKIIESKTLNSLLDDTKYKNKKIDFLNIDVEGADLDVLNSLNFEIYRPELICIEIIEKNIENSLIYKLLKKNNYIKIWSGAVSHLFKDNLV